MIASAKARHIRMSARKVRSVLDLIRGQSTNRALSILANTSKKAASVVNKVVRSAIANARNKGVEEEGLYISRIFADEGATWKRFRANAFGRGTRIEKKTCHISVCLDKKFTAPKVEPAKKKEKVKATVKPKTGTAKKTVKKSKS